MLIIVIYKLNISIVLLFLYSLTISIAIEKPILVTFYIKCLFTV